MRGSGSARGRRGPRKRLCASALGRGPAPCGDPRLCRSDSVGGAESGRGAAGLGRNLTRSAARIRLRYFLSLKPEASASVCLRRLFRAFRKQFRNISKNDSRT